MGYRDKQTVQLDSAHQIGIEAILEIFLIVSWSSIMEERKGSSRILNQS